MERLESRYAPSPVFDIVFPQEPIYAGDEFTATITVEDTRPEVLGIFSAWVDVEWSDNVEVLSVTHPDNFSIWPTADFVDPNRIEHAGGIGWEGSHWEGNLPDSPQAVIHLHAKALDPGAVDFILSETQGDFYELTAIGTDGDLRDTAQYGTFSTTVYEEGQEAPNLYPWDVDHDNAVTTLDAVYTINRLGTDDMSADIDDDGVVGTVDAIMVINRMGEICE